MILVRLEATRSPNLNEIGWKEVTKIDFNVNIFGSFFEEKSFGIFLFDDEYAIFYIDLSNDIIFKDTLVLKNGISKRRVYMKEDRQARKMNKNRTFKLICFI